MSLAQLERPSNFAPSWQRCVGWIGFSAALHIAVVLLLPSLPSGDGAVPPTPMNVALQTDESVDAAHKAEAASRPAPQSSSRNTHQETSIRRTTTPKDSAHGRTSAAENAPSQVRGVQLKTPPAIDDSARRAADAPSAATSERMTPPNRGTSASASSTSLTPPSPAARAEANTSNVYAEPVTDVRGLMAHIHTLIKHNANYPILAKRRGWEGEVLVGFRINSTGKIDNVRVALGSGYPILDSAAMNALRSVGKIADAAHWLPRGELELELALVYRLTDG